MSGFPVAAGEPDESSVAQPHLYVVGDERHDDVEAVVVPITPKLDTPSEPARTTIIYAW